MTKFIVKAVVRFASATMFEQAELVQSELLQK